MKIKPFAALRPPKALAEQVASVPYDVVDSAQAGALARGNEKSFLHVIKPEIDLPEGTDLYADGIYEKAAENFQAFQPKKNTAIRLSLKSIVSRSATMEINIEIE